ncbi:MAG: tetratricopeptide repeat protein [Thermodesulfobacteriota bacterium]
MVKKETLYIVALITFGVGFISGVIFSAVKSTPMDDGRNHPPQQATAQPQQQDKTEAIKALEQTVGKEPQNYEAWVRLGNNYYDTGQNEKAITAYDKALAINNGSANVWTDMGIMYRRTGQFDKAIESFEEGAKRDPSHIFSRFNKGIVLLSDLNDTAGAIAAWEEVLEINPATTTQNGRKLSDWVAELKASSPGSGTGGAR